MISDVIITGVKLKDQVVQQMSDKTMVIAQLASQKMTQEYQVRRATAAKAAPHRQSQCQHQRKRRRNCRRRNCRHV